MHPLIGSLLLALAVCQAAAAQERSFELRPGGAIIYVSLDTVDTPARFGAPPMTVYRSLLEVYRELKIPLTLVDSATGRLGHTGSPLRGIGGQRNSRWLSCGFGLTGPYADLHRVTMAVVSWVKPLGRDTAEVRTGVFASATDVAEGNKALRPCTTTGSLEERIRTLLGEKLAAAGTKGAGSGRHSQFNLALESW